MSQELLYAYWDQKIKLFFYAFSAGPGSNLPHSQLLSTAGKSEINMERETESSRDEQDRKRRKRKRKGKRDLAMLTQVSGSSFLRLWFLQFFLRCYKLS